MGNRGAHSWKNMLMYWSDSRRGGVIEVSLVVGDDADADLTCALNAGARISGYGPLDSLTFRAKASGRSVLGKRLTRSKLGLRTN